MKADLLKMRAGDEHENAMVMEKEHQSEEEVVEQIQEQIELCVSLVWSDWWQQRMTREEAEGKEEDPLATNTIVLNAAIDGLRDRMLARRR